MVLLGLLLFLDFNRFLEGKGARVHNAQVDFITLKPEPTFNKKFPQESCFVFPPLLCKR